MELGNKTNIRNMNKNNKLNWKKEKKIKGEKNPKNEDIKIKEAKTFFKNPYRHKTSQLSERGSPNEGRTLNASIKANYS